MNNHKISAESLISWQRMIQKCGKLDFGKVKVRLEIDPTPERIAAGRWYGYGLREQVTENV
jgi:hypothetical protein